MSDAAYRLLEQLRWDGSPRCPHCSSTSVGYLSPADGVRRTRTGAPTARRVWKCASCQRQFSVLTGTVLHGTRIDLTVWLAAVDDLAAKGVVPPAARLVRDHGVSWDAARHLSRTLHAVCELDEVRCCLPV